MFQLIQGLTGFVGKIMKTKLITDQEATAALYIVCRGTRLSFRAVIKF